MYTQPYGSRPFGNIGENIKQSFRRGSSLTRLIYINIGVFALLKILILLFTLFGYPHIQELILQYLGVPAWIDNLLYTPWTLVSYMFTHVGFLHILFNLLWLYWFGSIFLNYFSERQLTGVYLLGGLCGALLYIAAFSTLPFFEKARYYSYAIGASASVMAIVFAVCTYLPGHRINIFLIGPVKLIHLALFTAFIDLISIPGENAGGHIAHLGGALFGYIFTLSIRRNKDITSGLMRFMHRLERIFSFNPSGYSGKKVSKMNDREYNIFKKKQEEHINHILDKIAKAGYDSLSKEEKELLFKSGKK